MEISASYAFGLQPESEDANAEAVAITTGVHEKDQGVAGSAGMDAPAALTSGTTSSKTRSQKLVKRCSSATVMRLVSHSTPMR